MTRRSRYVRRERDWLARAQAEGRDVPRERFLPMLPAGVERDGGAVARPNGHGGGGPHLHAR